MLGDHGELFARCGRVPLREEDLAEMQARDRSQRIRGATLDEGLVAGGRSHEVPRLLPLRCSAKLGFRFGVVAGDRRQQRVARPLGAAAEEGDGDQEGERAEAHQTQGDVSAARPCPRPRA